MKNDHRRFWKGSSGIIAYKSLHSVIFSMVLVLNRPLFILFILLENFLLAEAKSLNVISLIFMLRLP